MAEALYHIVKQLKHNLTARHTKGFGVHSPFLFYFTQSVIYGKHPYYEYARIEKYRNNLLQCHDKIYIDDYGTGASAEKNIQAIAKTSLKNAKCGQLLFRIANEIKAKNILELGTSLGVTTCYLAAVNSATQCITMEGSSALSDIAESHFKKNGYKNIQLIKGNIDDKLSLVLKDIEHLDMVLFDANHTKEATLRYFEQCLAKHDNNSVFVFDDIYWSRQMQEAWLEIKKHKAVTATIDLFDMGIVFFHKNLQKKNYKMRF